MLAPDWGPLANHDLNPSKLAATRQATGKIQAKIN